LCLWSPSPVSASLWACHKSKYQVYFGSSSTSLALYTTVNAPAVTAALYNLSAGATYYWKVAAIVSGNPATSAVWSFTTPGVPQAPYPVSPLNGSMSSGPAFTLQWSAVPGATQYQVYLGSTSTSLSLYTTVNAPGVTAAVYNLNAGATYYWKVAAIVGGNAYSGGPWSFTIPGGTPTLSPPTVVWPLNGVTGTATTLTVQWSPVTGAMQYQIYFSDNAGNQALYATVFAPTVTEAIYNLKGGTTYYWKVVAVAGGNSASSQVWSFTTN
jgi:predicted RNase H-related nuclease YkuK (DUF458 family)